MNKNFVRNLLLILVFLAMTGLMVVDIWKDRLSYHDILSWGIIAIVIIDYFLFMNNREPARQGMMVYFACVFAYIVLIIQGWL